jgi:hypothetical protein
LRRSRRTIPQSEPQIGQALKMLQSIMSELARQDRLMVVESLIWKRQTAAYR